MFKFKLKRTELHPFMLVGKYFLSEMGNYIKVHGVDGRDNVQSGKRIYENYVVKYSYMDKKWGDIKSSTASFYAIVNRLKDGYIKFATENEVPVTLKKWEYSI